MQIWTKCTLKHIFKTLGWLRKLLQDILVWNFDLRIFLVYRTVCDKIKNPSLLKGAKVNQILQPCTYNGHVSIWKEIFSTNSLQTKSNTVLCSANINYLNICTNIKWHISSVDLLVIILTCQIFICWLDGYLYWLVRSISRYI